jgi:small subunit ribosomal protein S17
MAAKQASKAQAPAQGAQSETESGRGMRKVRQGVVVSDKMQKSVVVRVERTVRHPKYSKVLKQSKKYMAHNEDASVKEGDTVRIMECRPMSAHKRWRVIEVVKRGAAV